MIIDGIALAKTIKEDVKNRVLAYKSEFLRPPCLAVILCSEDPASQIYVNKKLLACKDVGIECAIYNPIKEHFYKTLKTLNADSNVDGVLVQLPVYFTQTPEIDIFPKIDPDKDVDVFHPYNIGMLSLGIERFVPCTPAAIHKLLEVNNINLDGKKVVIINRSNVVGKPLFSMLIQNRDIANATVTICHDHTTPERLKQICLNADVIVVAVGKPKFLTEDLVPEGCVVIDVGINRIGKKIVGDVDFDNVAPKTSYITKVPGGVGPMTVAMLLENVVKAACHRKSI